METTTMPDDDKKKEEEAKGEEKAAEEDKDKKEEKADDKKEEDKKKEDDKKEKAKDGDKKKEAEATTTTPSSSGGRERRARKSSAAYEPEDFTLVDRSVIIIEGRGKKLGDIKIVKESVENELSTHDLETVHKLLFKGGKKHSKKEMITNILSYSGFFAKDTKGLSEKELEKQNAANEKYMEQKVCKHTVAELKCFCDYFNLDRSGKTGKESLAMLLFDFLGEPSAKHVKGAGSGSSKKSVEKKKSKKRRSSKSKKDEEEDEDETEEEEDEEEEEKKPPAKKKSKKDDGKLHFKKGEMPSDDTIKKWAHAFCMCNDMEKATVKDALKMAGDKFGVDMHDKKDLLKELLSDEA